MTAWYNSRMVTFDLETTGVDIETDRIVTAAVAFVGGEEKVSCHEWLVNPGVKIPESASQIHGVTTEAASVFGVDPKKAVQEIILMLTGAVKKKMPLIIYNARFDITLLDREAKRYELEPLTERVSVKVVDPLIIDKQADPFRKESRKLEDVCKHYGVNFEGAAHNATEDALNAARLAWKIGHKYPNLNSLDLLHEKQIGWSESQAKSLQKYFDKSGKDIKVEISWPLT